MADTLQFRASACGAYVVSLVGEAAHVVALADAQSMVGLYQGLARDFEAAGKSAQAAYEASTANALHLACNRAVEIGRDKERARQARMGATPLRASGANHAKPGT